jgi:redox-sensitive bicupin YhaK (pirin superfamily)
MITLRRAKDRGHTQIDWLDSYHTFSFGSYQDRKNMNFGHLRVINEDRVKPGEGFGMHGHRDMEIITYIIEGALAHKDSLGTGSIIKTGEVQTMSAGTGVMHSEFNASGTEPVHFLQIWIIPEKAGLLPRYEQNSIIDPARKAQWQLMASRDGRDGSVTVHQDILLQQAFLANGDKMAYSLEPGRQAWLQVVCGTIEINDKRLSDGDGAAIYEEKLTITASEASEVLLFDLKKSDDYIAFEGD